ncbi:PilN domain-containing protein [Bowmanella pacifica]|uniref:Fimbrial assembly protein (PilN) n=1 Tax=Bowmanella pacifica TaxID=502051 RepID=A0A917Z2R8_9ALTE|nr:PilN domain-containing protein [Bowmanella pacifica]GGO71349.1 hypothetical protein GCM10010982_26940 [Bowmanella pacifica]
MKFSVNLYSEEMRPRYVLLTLPFMLLVWALVVILLLLGWGYAERQLAYWQVVEQQAGQRLQHQRTQIASQQQLLAREPSEELARRVVGLQEQVDTLKQIQNLLQQKDSGAPGYATFMLELAKYHEDGIWLNQIQVRGTQMYLQGGVQQSEALPAWLDRLSQSPYFQGKEFSNVTLTRDTQDNLQFVLSSAFPGQQKVADE